MQAGTHDGFRDTSGAGAKVVVHSRLLADNVGLPAPLLVLWIGGTLALAWFGRRWLASVPVRAALLSLALFAAIYLVWWLGFTPTEKAWFRRIFNGVLALEIVLVAVLGALSIARSRRARRNHRAGLLAAGLLLVLLTVADSPGRQLRRRRGGLRRRGLAARRSRGARAGACRRERVRRGLVLRARARVLFGTPLRQSHDAHARRASGRVADLSRARCVVDGRERGRLLVESLRASRLRAHARTRRSSRSMRGLRSIRSRRRPRRIDAAQRDRFSSNAGLPAFVRLPGPRRRWLALGRGRCRGCVPLRRRARVFRRRLLAGAHELPLRPRASASPRGSASAGSAHSARPNHGASAGSCR